MSGGRDSHLKAIKRCLREQNCSTVWIMNRIGKGKKYFFLCPISRYIVTGKNTRGSTYSWVDGFTIYMVPASYQLKGSQIAFHCRPWWTSKAPRSLSITGYGKGSIQVRTLPYTCTEVIIPRSYKFHELWKCLTSHCKDYYLIKA